MLPMILMPIFAMMPATALDRGPGGTVWRNPSDSVHVRFDSCGDRICGTVTWANAKAIADARRGSGMQLVGTRIFRGLREVRPNYWKGKVYVPDVDATFGGSIAWEGDRRMVGRGCLFAGIGCRSQVWTRVD
jgi:uncharacterized protein (DUF2147 family)